MTEGLWRLRPGWAQTWSRATTQHPCASPGCRLRARLELSAGEAGRRLLLQVTCSLADETALRKRKGFTLF